MNKPEGDERPAGFDEGPESGDATAPFKDSAVAGPCTLIELLGISLAELPPSNMLSSLTCSLLPPLSEGATCPNSKPSWLQPQRDVAMAQGAGATPDICITIS